MAYYYIRRISRTYPGGSAGWAVGAPITQAGQRYGCRGSTVGRSSLTTGIRQRMILYQESKHSTLVYALLALKEAEDERTHVSWCTALLSYDVHRLHR